MEYGYHAQGGLGFDDARALHDALVSEGKDPFDYLAPAREKYKKLADKKTGEYPGKLGEIAVNLRSTRFEGKKV
jgi:hypothetical protein